MRYMTYRVDGSRHVVWEYRGRCYMLVDTRVKEGVYLQELRMTDIGYSSLLDERTSLLRKGGRNLASRFREWASVCVDGGEYFRSYCHPFGWTEWTRKTCSTTRR